MSHREELIVLAAAARIAMGRDDRLTVEEGAEKAVAQALAMLDVIAVHEDGDEDDIDEPSRFEKGYEEGVAESEAKIKGLQEQLSESLEDTRDAQAKIASLQKLIEQVTVPAEPALEAAKQPAPAKK